MRYQNDDAGWVAADVSVRAPGLTSRGIVRLARMRNPWQMCICIMQDGTASLFHSESGMDAWSFLGLSSAKFLDVAVVPNDDGVDIPYFVVERTVRGITRLNIEAIIDWTPNSTWQYLESSREYNFQTPTNIITGLDHLEGKRVEVVGDGAFLGNTKVEGGTIRLLDQRGQKENVVFALVGLPNRAYVRFMPPAKIDPLAQSRYSKWGVRTIYSTRPKVRLLGHEEREDAQRPEDRTTTTPMGTVESLDVIDNHRFTILGWDLLNVIELEENLPFRCEIVGVFGLIESNTV